MTDAPESRLLRVKSKQQIPIGVPAFRIGRDRSCALRVNDRQVSRVHAEIRREGDAHVLYDFSTNGTWVNGLRVEERQALAHGDTIRVGGERLVFLTGPEKVGTGEDEVSPTAGTVPVEVLPTPRTVEPPAWIEPGERTGLLHRRPRYALPGWAYVAAALLLAVAAFVLGLLLV